MPASWPVSRALIMAALGAGVRLLARSKTSSPREGGRTAGQPEGTRPGAGSRRGRPALARHVTGTAVGGHLLLMAVVIAYYYGVARVAGDFIASAF